MVSLDVPLDEIIKMQKIVEVYQSQGDSTKIYLRGGSGSTGYGWGIKIENENVVKLKSSEYPQDGPGIGSPRTDVYVLEALSPGNSKVQLFLYGPGGPEHGEAVDSLEMIIQVHGK